MKKIGKWLPSTILAFTCIYGLGINCASGADYVWTGGAGADTNLRNGANWEGGVSPTTIEYTTLTALSGHNVVIPAGMIATDTGILTKNMTLTLNGTLSLGESTDVSSQFRGIWMNGKSNIVQSENGTDELNVITAGGSQQITLRNGNNLLVFRRGTIDTPLLTIAGRSEIGNDELFQQYGGTVTTTNFYVGNSGTGTYEQYGGTVTANNLRWGSGLDDDSASRTGTGTVKLYGGSVTAGNLLGNVDTNTETSIYIGDDSFGSLTITGNSNYTGKITVGLVNGFVAYQGETPIADAVFYNNTGTTDGNEIITASNLFSVTDTSSITLANDKNFGTYAIDGSAVTFKEGSQTGYLNINGIDGKYELKLFVDGIKDMVDFETWLNSDSTDITARVENENEVSFTGFDLGNFTFLYDFTGYENAVVSATGLSGASLPEPTTWGLLVGGITLLGIFSRKRVEKKA